MQMVQVRVETAGDPVDAPGACCHPRRAATRGHHSNNPNVAHDLVVRAWRHERHVIASLNQCAAFFVQNARIVRRMCGCQVDNSQAPLTTHKLTPPPKGSESDSARPCCDSDTSPRNRIPRGLQRGLPPRQAGATECRQVGSVQVRTTTSVTRGALGVRHVVAYVREGEARPHRAIRTRTPAYVPERVQLRLTNRRSRFPLSGTRLRGSTSRLGNLPISVSKIASSFKPSWCAVVRNSRGSL